MEELIDPSGGFCNVQLNYFFWTAEPYKNEVMSPVTDYSYWEYNRQWKQG